jgi:Domain of unknown function (DUF4375)/HEAT repeats
MKYVFLTLAVIVLLSVVVAFAFLILHIRRREPRGFRDLVKDPEYRAEMEAYWNELESLEVPENISDAEIEKMVKLLLNQKRDEINVRKLGLLGQKAVPELIRLLVQTEVVTKKFPDDGEVLGDKTPFTRVCNILSKTNPPQAGRPLAKFVDHPDHEIRKDAALVLGAIGTSECITPLVKALSDKEDYVRSYAMMGIDRGIDAKSCTREFLEAMFPPLTKLLNRDDKSISGNAPKLLLAIDPSRALPVLLSPEHFTESNRQVHYILKALNEDDHKIPHDKLLPFLKAVQPLSEKYPHDYNYAEALKAYAHHPDPSAEQLFHEALKSSNDNVQEAAAEALGILSGVVNARELVFEAVDSDGFDALSAPQKHYFAVLMYDGQVNNGGHSQYFFNSPGAHWKNALEGLAAIGAIDRAKILNEAQAVFGTAGPSTDNVTRRDELAALSSKDDETLDALDSRYYACKESIETLLAKYVIKHKDHFSKPK